MADEVCGLCNGAGEVWADDLAGLAEMVDCPRCGDEPVVEHAILMSGGSMQVRPNDPEIERIYPLAQWIPDHRRFGGKVYRRTVIVVEDWQEVTG